MRHLVAHLAVGTPVAGRPPHRSRRAVFPHRALRCCSLSRIARAYDTRLVVLRAAGAGFTRPILPSQPQRAKRSNASPFPMCVALPRSKYYGLVGLLYTLLLDSSRCLRIPRHPPGRCRGLPRSTHVSPHMPRSRTPTVAQSCNPGVHLTPAARAAREAVFCRPGRYELPAR